jgi:hypothetical protein
MLYNLYIFNRLGDCLYYKEWHRPKFAFRESPEEDQKMLFGLLFSFKNFVEKIAPKPSEKGMRSLRTDKYTTHLMETPSGLKFVLTSSPEQLDLVPQLEHIYSALYVEHVTRNPLYKLGSKIQSSRFEAALEKYVRTLPAWRDPS